MIIDLIDLLFYILLCSSYLIIILLSLLLIQFTVYQISKHKINLYKIIYNQFKKLI